MGDHVPAAEEAEALSSGAGALSAWILSSRGIGGRAWSELKGARTFLAGRGGTTGVLSGSNQKEHKGFPWHGLGFLHFSWITTVHHVWNVVVA